MKRAQSLTLILIIGMIISNLIALNTNNKSVKDDLSSKSSNSNVSTPRMSYQFELTQDFEVSTECISPESSPGENDGAFFSFKANKNGNYSIDVKNFPSSLTTSVQTEYFSAFDNPSGTDLYYLSYVEYDMDFLSELKIKLLKSEDRGKNWVSQTVATIPNEGDTFFEIMTYMQGMGIATNPSIGTIGIITYLNNSKLIYIGSQDNGTTWNAPITIVNATDIGSDTLLLSAFPPMVEIAILKNGTINVLTEANSNSFTDIVYFESHNNGSAWSAPHNITILNNIECYKPKMQVDYVTGNYWLMWRAKTKDGFYTYGSWVQFSPSLSETLSSIVPTFNISSIFATNFDFQFDQESGLFRIIQFQPLYITNFSTPSFGVDWTNTSLGFLPEVCTSDSYVRNSYFNAVYDGETYQFLYPEDKFTGLQELYQYTYFENSTFWRKCGNFTENRLMLIYWNGKKINTLPITTTTVNVEFTAQNGTGVKNIIEKSQYIFIDNSVPSFNSYTQNIHYFNPLSSNISLSKVLWDLLSSETCYVNLEVFQEDSVISDRAVLTDNIWDESDPEIFQSNTGQLYVLYQTVESGKKTIYLRRSLDRGITWNNPVEIYQYSYGEGSSTFSGAALGNIVVIIFKLGTKGHHYLFKSFDQGNTFQDPIDLNNQGELPLIITNNVVSDLVLTTNRTLYVSLIQTTNPYKFDVFESGNLGINWTRLAQWIDNNTFGSSRVAVPPALGYDSINNLIHIVLPARNVSYFIEGISYSNLSFSTLNLSNNRWSPVKSTGLFKSGIWAESPEIIITRENQTAPLIARAVYQNDIDFTQMSPQEKLIEIVSTDLGATWSQPLNSSVRTSSLTSDYDELYYVEVLSDGNDREIYFSREGCLVRFRESNINAHNITEFTFDGKDDFENYIEEGYYTYRIYLKDSGDNQVNQSGWFIADYTDPLICNLTTNWLVPPIPRYDVIITVNITDRINFTTYLYYKKDAGNWEKIRMNNTGEAYYTATILGDIEADRVEYYIKSFDLAGNEIIFNDLGSNFMYDTPDFEWDSDGLFEDTKRYSSSEDYSFTVKISKDREYVSKIIFRYSYDQGDSWEDLELHQNSPEFSGKLSDIPGDLRELYYKVIIIDIFGDEHELSNIIKIEFYPEVPSIEFNTFGAIVTMMISAIVGFIVAFGYIRLKITSQKAITKQIFSRVSKKGVDDTKRIKDKYKGKEESKNKEQFSDDLLTLEKSKIATPFTVAYIVILCGTIAMFLLGIYVATNISMMGILIIGGSLLLGVYGYMILMSRDITIDLYLEKIFKRNIALEIIQMAILFVSIITILLFGYTMDWFRYYLVESTFNFGIISIPRLYLSVLGVFFTSLVLVIITTYIQLNKTVYNVFKQRTQGASESVLLFSKDQNSSRLITYMGYKTIVFLVTVLLGIFSTTNLLTVNLGMALLIILVPFVLSSFSALILSRLIEKKKRSKQKDKLDMLFVDSKKICKDCGESVYLSDKFCSNCGKQQIFSESLGTYVSRCAKCNALLNDKAKFCTKCGDKILEPHNLKKSAN